MHLIALVGAAGLVLGAFLPWMQVGIFQQRGIDTLDGGLVLAAGLLGLIVAGHNLARGRNEYRWAYLPGGILALIVVLVALARIDQRAAQITGALEEILRLFGGTEKIRSTELVGSGLVVVLVGSMLLFAAGLTPIVGKRHVQVPPSGSGAEEVVPNEES